MAAKRLRLKQWLAHSWARFKNSPKYVVWHTGLQPAVPVFQKFIARRRKVVHWLRYQVKKKAFFKTWNTRLQPASPSLFKFVTRVRKIRKQASFKFRKLAKYQLFHTGLSPAAGPNPVQNLGLKSHKRKKLKRKRRPASYTLFHTGQATLSPVVHFISRRRRVKVVTEKRRKALFHQLFNTGATPPIVVDTGNWLGVSLRAYTRRGGV